MKIKKLTAFFLAATMLLLTLLSGCSKDREAAVNDQDTGETAATKAESREEGSSKPLEVTFWTLSTRQEAVDPIVKAFNTANNNIKVAVSYYDTDGMKDACKVAATAETLPDMWFHEGDSKRY